MIYQVDKNRLEYFPEGKKAFGKDEVLLDKQIDLTYKTAWKDQGFHITPLFDSITYKTLQEKLKNLIINILKEEKIETKSHLLDQYHRLIGDDYQKHLSIINRTKLLPIQDFPLDIRLLEESVSSICKTPLITKNPFDKQRVFHFRIVRPNSTDNNPLHRDVWLEDYDDCINLYLPITGSNTLSSLILIPGSHRWKESRIEKTLEGALVNNVKFNVPAVSKIAGDYDIIRACPKENETLIFSPYLIHGGATNLNMDITRVSLEMRLWKKQ